MPSTVSCSLGRPCTREATAPSTSRGSSTTQTGRPVARARSRPVGSVSTAVAPRSAASAAYRAPCVRAPGRAAYRSPGRTSPEARAAPVTVVEGSPWTGGPIRSASSARESGRFPAGRGTDLDAVGLTTLQSTGGGPAACRSPVRPRVGHPAARPWWVSGSGDGEGELRARRTGGDHAAGGERVAHDVGEHRRGDLPALRGAGGAFQVDGDHVLRVVGRGVAHEGGEVPAALVAAAVGVGPLCGAGLADHPEAVHLA